MMRSHTAAVPSERFKRPARIENNNRKTRHKEVERPQLAGEKERGRTNKEEEVLFFFGKEGLERTLNNANAEKYPRCMHTFRTHTRARVCALEG